VSAHAGGLDGLGGLCRAALCTCCDRMGRGTALADRPVRWAVTESTNRHPSGMVAS
jgi:hypothetical protein